GAIVFYALERFVGDVGFWYLVILCIIAIAMVLFLPKGLWGLISRGGRLQLFPTGLRLATPLVTPLATPLANTTSPTSGTPPTTSAEDL
ncbi:MAG: hypothetical protein WCI43_08110, partial [Candidatus Firestonebacteria bacterium]